MQEKIDRFNAAFVDMAADYVERLRLKIVQASVITVAEKRAGTARIDEPDWKIQLPDQVRIADCLAVSVGRIEDRMERRRNADADKQPKEAADKLDFLRDFLEGKTRWNFPEGTVFNVNTSTGDGAEVKLKPETDGEPEPPAVPEPVTLGPGTSFRLENTNVSKPCVAVDGVNVDALPVLNNLCGFCRAAAKHGGVTPEREWAVDAAALEFAISVLSELEEIREVRIPAQTDTPGAWELMRDILAGKRPAPEGTVFDVVIDVTGNPQAIRRREEPGYTARSLALSMPGGEVVKLNSAAEAYGLAACVEKMAARVWPEAAPGK